MAKGKGREEALLLSYFHLSPRLENDMKASEMKVGGHYIAVVSGKLTTVRLDEIQAIPGNKYRNATTRYICTNLTTGRECSFKSALKFRKEAGPFASSAEGKQKTGKTPSAPTTAETCTGNESAQPTAESKEQPLPFPSTANSAKTPARTPTTKPDKQTVDTVAVPSHGDSEKPTTKTNGTPTTGSDTPLLDAMAKALDKFAEEHEIVLLECDKEIGRFQTIAEAKDHLQQTYGQGQRMEWVRKHDATERWLDCNDGQFKIKSVKKKVGERHGENIDLAPFEEEALDEVWNEEMKRKQQEREQQERKEAGGLTTDPTLGRMDAPIRDVPTVATNQTLSPAGVAVQGAGKTEESGHPQNEKQPKQQLKQSQATPLSKLNNDLASSLRAKMSSSGPVSLNLDRLKEVAGYRPTDQQRNILDKAVEPGLKELVVAAGAGASKTTTLRMLECVLKGVGQYTAFNAALVAESATKFRKAACNTTHSLAWRVVGKHFTHRLKGARMKSSEIAYRLGINDLQVDVNGLVEPKTLTASFLAGQVLMACRRYAQSADREISKRHFKYIGGIDVSVDGKRTYANNDLVKEYLLRFAKVAWEDAISVTGQLPYTPDYYVKLWQLGEGRNRPMIGADYILLDEAQDTAPVMLDILKQQTHALVVVVGDENQQLYDWRGAVDAMKEFPNAPRMPLSQSFRFGQVIADVANSILSGLDEPTDLVMKGHGEIPSRVCEVESPRAILCRTNAMAVGAVLQAVADGGKPFLIGGGKEVIAFVEAAKMLQDGHAVSHQDLACFSSWKEVQTYVEQDEGEDLKLMVKIIDSFKCDPILNALKNMPKEEDASVVVSTVHKCVHPDTLVETPEGLVPIRDISIEGVIGTPSGPKEYQEKFTRESGPTITITTKRGYQLTTTPEHGITIWRNGSHDRIEAWEVLPDDWVRVRLGSVIEQTSLPPLPKATSGDVREQQYRIPTEMTEELAEFLGLMVADGVIGYRVNRPYKLCLGKMYPSVVNRFGQLATNLFGYEGSSIPMEGGTKIEVCSTAIARWVESIGGLCPYKKYIPSMILKSPVNIQAAFLRGLFEDGTISVRSGIVDHIAWYNYDYSVVGVVQVMLLRQGIVSSRTWSHNCGRLYLYSQHAKMFSEKIGFVAEEKNTKLVEFGEDHRCLIPLTRKELLPLEKGMTVFQKQNARERGYISRNTAQSIVSTLGPQRAAILVGKLQWSYERVKSVEITDESETICVTVPDGSRFIQNGFDGWNSKGKEWPSVQLAGDFPAPQRMSDSDRRVLYVAGTRAKYLLDISHCPTFIGEKGKDGYDYPGLKINYTIDMPSVEALEAYEAQVKLAKALSSSREDSSEGYSSGRKTLDDRSTVESTSVSPPEQDAAGGQGASEPVIAVNGRAVATEFTWVNFANKWCVRGPLNMEGKLVSVKKKAGGTSSVMLKEVVSKFPDAWVYGI